MKVNLAREIALKILYKIDKQSGYSNLVLDEYLENERKKLTKNDIEFISKIVYGVVTWKLTLDSILEKYSKTKINKISTWIINILRMGIYQIIFLDKVPKSAAVDESVKLCKKYGFKSANFVNAILRKVEKEDYLEFNQIPDKIQRISKMYSMPEWLIEEFLEEYDIQTVEEICKNSNLKPYTTIRINKLKITKDNLIKQLEEKQISYKESYLEDFIYLEKVKNISNIDLFQKGYFTVQDEGAGIISIMLEPKQGQKILDACSAPGGKTTYIAELIKDNGEIIAWDLYPHRLELVKQNINRLGIKSIKTQVKDATILDESYIEKFDKILIDVPCLGFGVMKRKPDIKWQRNKQDIKKITKIQIQILNICSNYLKKGGEILYSTCSILKKENQDIINEFLKLRNVEKNRTEVKFEKIMEKLILPKDKTDGFYICKLRKS